MKAIISTLSLAVVSLSLSKVLCSPINQSNNESRLEARRIPYREIKQHWTKDSIPFYHPDFDGNLEKKQKDEHVTKRDLGKRADFENPIIEGTNKADPWVIEYNDEYYLLYTTGLNNIQVYVSNTIADFNVDPITVYTPAANTYTAFWAPEMHTINGLWYIYYSAVEYDDTVGTTRRMHVLEGSSPTGQFTDLGIIGTSDNNWAIDGTVLKYGTGINYFIWSGWSSDADQSTQYLYIAEMSSPSAVTGSRVLLHSPTSAWECNGACINEGPEILVNNGRTFLVFSASGSWTADYCLGMIGVDNEADPLTVANWWTLDRCVFESSGNAVGVGHASFPFDADDTPYIVYHGMQADVEVGWDGRTIRAQPFQWNTDSSPWFPTPVDLGVEVAAPVGYSGAPAVTFDYTALSCTGAGYNSGGGPASSDCSTLWTEVTAKSGTFVVDAFTAYGMSYGTCTIQFCNWDTLNNIEYSYSDWLSTGEALETIIVDDGNELAQCVFEEGSGSQYIQVQNSASAPDGGSYSLSGREYC